MDHLHAHTTHATVYATTAAMDTVHSSYGAAAPQFIDSFSDAIIESEPSHNHISGHIDANGMSGSFHNDNFSFHGSTDYHGHNSMGIGTGGTFNEGHGSWSVGGQTNFHGHNSIGGSIGWDF